MEDMNRFEVLVEELRESAIEYLNVINGQPNSEAVLEVSMKVQHAFQQIDLLLMKYTIEQKYDENNNDLKIALSALGEALLWREQMVKKLSSFVKDLSREERELEKPMCLPKGLHRADDIIMKLKDLFGHESADIQSQVQMQTE